jgi:transposase
MLFLGIDIASEKHDCCIVGEDSTELTPVFVIENNAEGFDILLKNIYQLTQDSTKVRIGLESTGHYGNNLISYIKSQGFRLTVFNPLQVELYRKSQTLRKTKTDKVAARLLAHMLMSGEHKEYVPPPLEISELKTLVRHRYRVRSMRTRLKISVARLVTILFPELRTVVSSIHQATVYALLLEMPTAREIADCHLTKLTNLLYEKSKHRYGRDKAVEIKYLAAKSIGQNSIATGFELQQTIRLSENLHKELDLVDKKIKSVMLEIDSPILTIPGISYNLGSIILAEIGSIHNFKNPNKLLAFAGLDPGISQSGKFNADNMSMVKRGSTYLRWALLQASMLVARNCPTFNTFAAKKEQEGKHYNVVRSHVGRKLIRVIFHLLKNNVPFNKAV